MVNSKSYDYNKWEILRGWDVSTHLVGQYIRGLMFDDAKAVIKIQTPGIYYISFHVILENIEDSLTAAISINNKFDSFPIVSALRVNETSTVGASGFLKLTASDTISVAAYSTKSYTVSKNTALIIRYHDDALSVSGFLFSLPEYALNNKTTSLMLGPWAAPIYGQFSSSLSFQPGQYEYTVPINGSYMITLNLILTILQFEYDVQLSLYASNLLIFNIDIEEIPFSTATVNLNEIVHLNFGEVLRVILTTNGARLNLQDMSSWSVLLLMQQEDIVNGFRGTLENSLIIFDTNEYQIIGKWLPQNNTLDFSQLLSSSVENGNSFNTKSDGMFYATVDLSFSLFMNISQKGYFSLSFFQEPNGIFAEKQVIPKLQGITIDGLSVQTYRVSLAGVFELSRTTPLSVAIDGKNISKFIINKESSFAIIETSSLYPGFHGALDSSMHVSNNDRNKIKEWKSFNSDIGGLYDFTNGLSIGNDIYTVSEDGLYLAVANIVVSDVDDGCIYGFVKRLSTDSDSVSAKCCSLALKMAFNFGGFFLLKRGETLFVELQANIDEDWKVLLSGFTVAYMGMNPIYFQSGLNDVVVVDQGTITIDNWQNTADSLVTNGKFVAPYDGVYFTVANIIVKVDRYFESEKKAYISIDGQEVKGLYSKKKTYIGTSFILFLSGSFYATKNSIIAVNLQTGTQLNVLVESTWGIVLVSSSTEVSGALGVLNKDSYFSDQVGDWKNAGIWTFNDNQDFNGQYLQSITLSFDDSTYINVLEEGVYLISANIEVFCNVIRSLYKISVHLNDDLETGLTVWQSSTWKKETLHLCGALFLKKNDKIYLRVSFDNFLDTTILSGSGLSIVLLSNSEASSSFFAILKDDFDVGSIEKTLSKWYFPTLLATNNFDLNTGIVNISQSGFYMLSITLLFEKSNQTFVNGVTVALLVNANAKINFSLTFQETELHFHFSEIYFFNFEDTISLSVVNNYDTLKISESQSHFNISEEMLNAKIRKTVSSFSLSYLPEMKASRGWSMNIFAQEIVNAHETDFSLESWSDLKEQSGSSPEGDYFVKTSGNYLLESKINLYNINGSVEISFVNDKAKICTSALECIGNCRILLEMNCFAALILNDAVSIVVKSSDSPVRVDIGSLRVVNLITTSNVGFGKTLFSDLRLELTLDNWHSVGPWVSNKTNYYGLFDKNFQTFENKSIVLKQGTYQVVANLIVDFRRSNFNSNCSITLMSGVFVDNDLAVSMFQQTVLYAEHNVITINLVGNFKIRKWAQMEIKMKLSTNANITLLKSSSWGAVLIANSSFSRSSDKGPLMLTKFSPANYSTWLVGLTKEWICEAAGDGDLTYIWYKNNEIIDVQQSTIGILKIAGYINDSGSYNCVVELDNINASSNSLNVNIYDINECALNIYNCSKNATCYNTPGSFICLCNHGFFDDGLECIDENECTTGNFLCGINAQCINTFGSYICMCNKGFEGDGRDCRNINECLDSLRNNQSICVPNAECEDTIGSYTCKCPVGFEGNGTVSCNDKNECDDSNFCYLNSVCINTIGSAKCKCNPGYSAYGKQCIDTDECMGPNPCINGNCSNTVGSFTCLCPTGYLLNGFTCEANSPQSGKQTTCLKDSQSYACLCGDNAKRENNILCNGLFLALIILSVIAVIVVIFVVKYMKSRKLKKIGPVKVHKEKYIEMENEFEI